MAQIPRLVTPDLDLKTTTEALVQTFVPRPSCLTTHSGALDPPLSMGSSRTVFFMLALLLVLLYTFFLDGVPFIRVLCPFCLVPFIASLSFVSGLLASIIYGPASPVYLSSTYPPSVPSPCCRAAPRVSSLSTLSSTTTSYFTPNLVILWKVQK